MREEENGDRKHENLEDTQTKRSIAIKKQFCNKGRKRKTGKKKINYEK